MRQTSSLQWSTRSFKEVAKVVTGTTPPTNHPEYYGKFVPFIGPTELGGTEPITRSSKGLSAEGVEQARLLPAESVLVCCIGATIGKVGFSGTELATNQQINALVFDQEVVFPRYAFHYCRTLKAIIQHQGASTTLPLLPKGRFQELKIPLPPIAEQKRIAAILDKAEEIRELRRQVLKELDAIVQSIFLEMFGNPSTNPKEWETAQLGDLIHLATDGPHVSPAYVDDGIPFLSARHIRRGEVLWTDLKFISTEDAIVHWRKCKPEKGDLLYTKGGTTGIAKVVDFEQPIALWVHVALLKTNHVEVNPLWLENMLNSDFCYQQSQRLTHGIANRDLGLKRMVRIQLYLPPLLLQNEFARRIEAIAQLKATHCESLAQLDALFSSLQHRAFRGEL